MEDLFIGGEQTPERLETKINEVTADKAGDVGKVLSFFPEQATIFIKIQEYASKTLRKDGIHFMVRHFEDGKGFKEKTFFTKDQNEYLDYYDTAQYLFKVDTLIERFRSTDPNKPFVYDAGAISLLFGALEQKEIDPENLSKQHLMILKLLEIKKVIEKEISLMKQYCEALREADNLYREADELKNQMTALREKAGSLVEIARIKIEQHAKSR